MAIGGLLILAAVMIGVQPDQAPSWLALALVTTARPWWDAWRSTGGTALRPALLWGALAIVAAIAAQAVGWSEPIAGGRPGAGRLTYLSTLAALAALGSVLNARAPGGRVWAGLMAILVVVFLIPWLEGPWRVRRAGGLTLLHLDAPWTIFYGLLVLVGVTNYLPTRFGAAAGWLTLGFVLEYLGLTRDDWPPSRRALLWAWSSWSLAASVWTAHRGGRRAPAARTRVERLWFWFRDLWGVVWALRILERFNRTAELKGWPVRLGWFGLEPAGPSAVAGPVPAGGSAAVVVVEDPPEAEAAFRGLIRRFAQPDRIDAILTSPGAASSCQPSGGARS
jgi:hypothetical protein